MPEAVRQRRYELSERVQQGALDGFLDIGPVLAPETPSDLREAATAPLSLVYQSNLAMEDGFGRWAERVVNDALMVERCERAGLSPAMCRALLTQTPVQTKGLSRRDPVSGAIEEVSYEEEMARILVPATLAGLMFLIVMVGATPLMQGVLEEKTQRIAEVLLGSVQPHELMMGKLLGVSGVSLSLATIYLGGAYWLVHSFGFAKYLPPALLVWFVAYQVLSVLMYGGMFIAIGAACTSAKDSQTLMIPVALLITFPLLALQPVIQDPNGAFAVVASLVPFSAPVVMLRSLSLAPAVPAWQSVLSATGLVVTTLLCVYVAGQIFGSESSCKGNQPIFVSSLAGRCTVEKGQTLPELRRCRFISSIQTALRRRSRTSRPEPAKNRPRWAMRVTARKSGANSAIGRSPISRTAGTDSQHSMCASGSSTAGSGTPGLAAPPSGPSAASAAMPFSAPVFGGSILPLVVVCSHCQMLLQQVLELTSISPSSVRAGLRRDRRPPCSATASLLERRQRQRQAAAAGERRRRGGRQRVAERCQHRSDVGSDRIIVGSLAFVSLSLPMWLS